MGAGRGSPQEEFGIFKAFAGDAKGSKVAVVENKEIFRYKKAKFCLFLRNVRLEISLKRIKLIVWSRWNGRGVFGYASLAVNLALAYGKLINDDDVWRLGGIGRVRAFLLCQ